MHFVTCFLDEPDPKPSRFKQEKKAIYAVYNEKYDALLAPFSLS